MSDSKVSKSAKGDKPHTRSRSGCHTCRLRRKKCDETKPICRACRHLGVDCEYSRPSWWSHPDRRRQHKEAIKNIIKQTKLNEKPPSAAPPVMQIPGATINTPPSLCNSSMPTADSSFPDAMAQTRAASVDSNFSPQFSLGTPQDFFNSTPLMPPPQWTPVHHTFPHFSPFEVDIKTERQMFVNDIPTFKDSTISTFSSYQQPQIPGQDPIDESWVQREHLESNFESFGEEPLDLNVFDYTHAPLSPSHQSVINVEECDTYLLEHFLENVAGLIFPILDVNQHGSARSDVILPALETNKSYLHCCLSIAAMHLKAIGRADSEQIDNDIMRHRFAAVSELTTNLNEEGEHAQLLEAILGLIFFQSSVAAPNDDLLDIPWHEHFKGATSLIERLQLLHESVDLTSRPHSQLPFNTTLASWVDIIGASMLGRAPVFSDSYRDKVEAGIPSGFAPLMGCDDRIMYLISEISCLGSLKQDGLDHMTLFAHVQSLGHSLSMTETGPGEVASVYSPSGAVRPRQLSRNITAIYRVAARLYLVSLVPTFDRKDPSIVALVESIVSIVGLMPSGPSGFDRSIVWPLLIAGSASIQGSTFRQMMAERVEALGDVATVGSFGRVNELLHDVWTQNDDLLAQGLQGVHWRDVMQQKNWENFLLI